MTAANIWTQLITTLRDNITLSRYIKYVYEGFREPDTMDGNSLPCIMVEPTQDGQIEKEMNNVQNVYFNVNIFAFSSNNFSEFPKTIVGDQNYKGILDIANDIRACLISSNTLGSMAIDTRIDPTVMDTIGGKYPIRGLMMPLRILYRQTEGI